MTNSFLPISPVSNGTWYKSLCVFVVPKLLLKDVLVTLGVLAVIFFRCW